MPLKALASCSRNAVHNFCSVCSIGALANSCDSACRFKFVPLLFFFFFWSFFFSFAKLLSSRPPDWVANGLRFTRAERCEGTAARTVSARSGGYKRVLGGPSIFEINPRPLGRLALHEMASDVCEHFSLVWGRQILVNVLQTDPPVAVLAIQGYDGVSIYESYKYWRHVDTFQPGIIELFTNASRMQSPRNQ